MRNLLLALILANLAFAAWHRWYSPQVPARPSAEREFGEIMLASEFADANPPLEIATVRIDDGPAIEPGGPAPSAAPTEPPPGEEVVGATSAAAAAPPPAVTESSPGAMCTSIGPFRELSQVTSAAANLRADGHEPRQRAGEGEVWSGYWVYLERIDAIEEAQTMIDNLHANGVGDAYIIPNSDSGILISLGVFSEIIRASRIRERVRELGYEATIADRVRRATVYWIDIGLSPDASLDLERLQPPGRIIRLEQRPCAEVEL
jgi:hypothetical protein